ncbi:Tetratricopeptide repeat-containing protein [Thermoflavifilum thermophilum]|uniref:Tetratricopeptide repeat-containing protein n=2 Tax=Thermoflavifilum thermophilum TaxID=1393122 RepID=A0A1I7NFB6_9BACT|nr:Tetratricopeptide repeat-containing protein [Thermoflavifilum thermophilum]
MVKWRFFRLSSLWIYLFLIPLGAAAQLNLNQVLGGEQNNAAQQDSIYATMEAPASKLATKKFTLTRRWYQNLVTHFNFVYNARQNLQKALQMATGLHQDDYTRLLNFYPYSFAELAQASSLLDSVIFRASVGIQVHDPRGKWIDDLYLLVGKAYYYEQKFTEAERAFQFINLRDAPAVKGEYTPVIGSLAEGSTQISIASPEKNGFFYHHPSRNEALLWLVKTYLAEQQIAKARTLLNQLLGDPRFPSRLQGSLYETAAFFYYQLQQDDETIPYLRKAIALQTDKRLKSRWAYLLGQIELQQKDTNQAIAAFRQAMQLSHEPLLEFYAAYQIALLQQIPTDNGIQPYEQLAEMARKNKYERYRDVIYHGLAQIALSHSDTAKGIGYLLSSLHAQTSPSLARGNSAIMLASLMMEKKQFALAANYLDTALQVLPGNDPRRDSLQEQLTALKALAMQMDVVYRQDSLQRLAALPPDARMQKVHAVWEDMLAQQRRAERAAQREAQPNAGQSAMPAILTMNPTSAPGNQPAASGNWYFNNPDLKASGFVAFKQLWGNRPLVDNWRRAAAIRGFEPPSTANPTATVSAAPSSVRTDSALSMGEKTLLANIPLTPEQLKASNDSISYALLQAARIFNFQLNRPDFAKDVLNTLLQRNPQSSNYPEIAYLLFLAYSQLHDSSQAAYYREVLLKNYPQTEYTRALRPVTPMHTLRLSTLYDSAYTCYEQQRYSETLQWIQQGLDHHPADSLQMQFSLLQAMALLKLNREDSARHILQTLALQYPQLPAGAEASRILGVLQHKQELIARLESSSPGIAGKDSITRAVTAQPASHTNGVPVQPKIADTAARPVVPPPRPPQPVVATPYALNEKDPHFVIMLMQPSDADLLEAATQRFSTYLHAHAADSSLQVGPYALTPTQTMVVFRIFPDENHALEFLDQIRASAPALLKGLAISEYAFYIISRSNFILLNQTKDLNGYINFFNDNYITQ